MSFEFVQGWDVKLFGPLDARMNQTLQKGIETAKSHAHVDTGQNKASISGGYNQNTRTLMVWADKPWSLVEEMRGGNHAYLAPAMQAMAGFWGGTYNLEMHFPNAAPKGIRTTQQDLDARESRWRKANLGFMARRKVKVITRRWHRRTEWPQADPTTPLI
jgi:hypothetical protein